jgi:hypothetical protein
MSYTPGFAPDGRSQWRALPPELQEITLDELDRVAMNPPESAEFFSHVVREQGSLRTHLFVHVVIDHARQKVVLVGTGAATTPILGA